MTWHRDPRIGDNVAAEGWLTADEVGAEVGRRPLAVPAQTAGGRAPRRALPPGALGAAAAAAAISAGVLWAGVRRRRRR